MKKTCRYNIAGIRYGHLTAIEPTDRRDGTNIIWRFRCDCGRIVERTTKHLTDHSACEICRPRGFGLRKDYTGQRFGRLVALECTGEHKGKELVNGTVLKSVWITEATPSVALTSSPPCMRA